ncbi:MAG: YkgJ family cysteine cluster protein [Proteobacteria bacterium]|nr:YkgJ family cysteine cluster protein [Pseudomonadota bacterium]
MFRHLITRLKRSSRSPVSLSRGGCRACGLCCELLGGTLQVCDADLQRWREQGRHDLLARVGANGRLWQEPDSGAALEDCPYLERTGEERAGCRIHDTKPQICRDYPTRAHGKRCVRGVLVD